MKYVKEKTYFAKFNKIANIIKYLSVYLLASWVYVGGIEDKVVASAQNDAHLNILLSSQEIIESYSSSQNALKITFSVSRIKCSACAWKIESFLQTQPQYLSWFIDIPQSSVSVTISSWETARQFVIDLAKLGFDAVPIHNTEDVAQLKAKEFQSELHSFSDRRFLCGQYYEPLFI